MRMNQMLNRHINARLKEITFRPFSQFCNADRGSLVILRKCHQVVESDFYRSRLTKGYLEFVSIVTMCFNKIKTTMQIVKNILLD